MLLNIARLRKKLFNSKEPINAALKVAPSCGPERPVAKREAAAQQEIDPLAIVEAYLERVAIVQMDGQCCEKEAQQIAIKQIRDNYICFKRP